MPVADRFSVGAKLDTLEQEQGLETDALGDERRVPGQRSLGCSVRVIASTIVSTTLSLVSLTQEQGERADAVLQVGYDSYRQPGPPTGSCRTRCPSSGDRQENARAGVGGSFRATDKLRIDAEVSDGDLGPGGRIGTNYLHSDRTSVYLNYALENERTDNGLRSGRGSEGNLVAGVKSRIADSTSVFLEERYQHGTTMTGLTHATGISFAPTENVEPRYQHRHRHAAGPADRCRDGSCRRRSPDRVRQC